MVKLILFGIFVCLALVGCVQGNVVSDDTIKIGVLAPLSGEFDRTGKELREGLESVLGSNFQLIYEDTHCDPKTAVNAFNKLAHANNIDYFLGPACGGPQEAIIGMDTDDIFILLDPAPAHLSEKPNVFQAQYTLEQESKFIASQIPADKKVLMIYYTNAFAESHAVAFRNSFEGELVEEKFGAFGEDIRSLIITIQQEQPDVIYTPGLSFFVDDGMNLLIEGGFDIPVYTTYVGGLAGFEAITRGSIYSHPNINESSVTHYSKQGLTALQKALSVCDSKKCVQENFKMNQSEIILIS
jgi:branched-chain amino acid transport system substrate-binding protein